MPVITVQLGQCGNQLGSSFFSTLGEELAANDYGATAVQEFFRPGRERERQQYLARAVLIDMEPKVVAGARVHADALNSWWAYPSNSWLCQQSGSGNNWAQGFHGYGPKVHDAALEIVRREVEHCDCMTGFLLLQSMAGGTGAGLGTYVAQALRDEYHSANIMNCCIWPYESGEVIVQPYNTLFTLSHLADLSDGIMLLENEALHRVCVKLYNIARPAFKDMNGVAARAMAAMLLPSCQRPAATGLSGQQQPGTSPGHRHAGGSGSSPSLGGARRGSLSGAAALATPAVNGTQDGPPGGAGPSLPVSVLGDVVSHLCCHPGYRLMTLRAVPQMPPTSVDFTTFSWNAILKRLRQMLLTGSILEEGMDWGVSLGGGGASAAAAAALGSGPPVNRSLASWLVLRGQSAGDVDASDFADPALYARWSADPLMVSSHVHKFNKCAMSGALLATDQRCTGPIQRMQQRAYAMLASRAFVHQYGKWGLGVQDFTECFAHVEDTVARYAAI